MTQFKLKESEIARLKVFLDYVRKLNLVYPLNEKQIFLITGNNKLTIYANGKSSSGGAGQAEMTIDIDDYQAGNEEHFVSDLSSILNLIGKIKTGTIQVNFDDKQIIFSGVNGKGKFKSTLFIHKEQSELDEAQNFIKETLANEFKSPIVIDIKDNYKRFSDFSSLTRVLNVTDVIEVATDGSMIKFADNLCILSYSDGQKTGAQEVKIETNLIPMIKEASKLELSNNQNYVHFVVDKQGIEVIYAPKQPKWQYPTDQDILDICPEQGEQYKLEINAKAFYETIDNFYGVFQPQFWRYSQIKIETKDITNSKELRFQYDDMASDIEEFLPVKVIETGKEDNFIWQLPTCYLMSLKDEFVQDNNSTIILTYNGLSESDPHGAGITISNGNTKVVIAKLND